MITSYGTMDVQADLIVVGEDVYVRRHGEDYWKVHGLANGGFGNIDGMLKTVRDIAFLDGTSLLGREEVEGLEVYVLGGTVGPGVLESAWGDFFRGLDSARVRYLLGVKDYLLHGIDAEYRRGELVTKVSLRFRDHGKETDIRAPEDLDSGEPFVSGEAEPSLEVLELLAAVDAAARGVESGSFNMTLLRSVELGGRPVRVRMVMSGDFELPDRQRFTVSVVQGQASSQTEMVLIGQDVYLRASDGDSWDSDISALLIADDFRGLLRFAEDAQVLLNVGMVDVQEIGGREFWWLRGDIGPGLLDGAWSAFSRGTDKVGLEFRFDVEDPALSVSTLDFSSGGELVARFSLEMLEYGGDYDIRAPDVDEGGGWNLAVGQGFCDGLLRERLVSNREVEGALEFNRLVSLVQGLGPGCRKELWDPRVTDGSGETVLLPDAGPVWAGDGIVRTGVSRCFGPVVPVSAAEETGMSVGGSLVPAGLREDGGGDGMVQARSGRDADNNILVYWGELLEGRPHDGAACWLYLVETGLWSEGY